MTRLLYQILKKADFILEYPFTERKFYQRLTLIETQRIRELTKIARPLHQNNFPMSLIVDKLGALVAESFLTPFAPKHSIHKNRRRQRPLSMIIVDPLIGDRENLRKEYETLYHHLKFDREGSNTLTKEARMEIYEAFVPRFQEFISRKGAGTRGGDRKSKIAKERIATQKSAIISIAQIQRVCSRLIPDSMTYTEIQRDIAHLKAAREVRNRPPESFIQSVQVHGYFNKKQYLENIHHLKNDELQVEIQNLHACISALQTEIQNRKRPASLTYDLNRLKDKNRNNTMLGIRSLHENIEKVIQTNAMNQALLTFAQILNMGHWNPAFPSLLTDNKTNTTNIQISLIELVHSSLEVVEKYNIQIDHKIIKNLNHSAKSLLNHSTPRMQKLCAKLANLSDTVLNKLTRQGSKP